MAPMNYTAVRLISFTGAKYDSGVLLQWRTGYEIDNLGFNLYREINDDGVRTKVNAIADRRVGTPGGTGRRRARRRRAYARWDLDPAASDPTVTYWLEDVEFNGKSKVHGPVTPIVEHAAGADHRRFGRTGRRRRRQQPADLLQLQRGPGSPRPARRAGAGCAGGHAPVVAGGAGDGEDGHPEAGLVSRHPGRAGRRRIGHAGRSHDAAAVRRRDRAGDPRERRVRRYVPYRGLRSSSTPRESKRRTPTRGSTGSRQAPRPAGGSRSDADGSSETVDADRFLVDAAAQGSQRVRRVDQEWRRRELVRADGVSGIGGGRLRGHMDPRRAHAHAAQRRSVGAGARDLDGRAAGRDGRVKWKHEPSCRACRSTTTSSARWSSSGQTHAEQAFPVRPAVAARRREYRDARSARRRPGLEPTWTRSSWTIRTPTRPTPTGCGSRSRRPGRSRSAALPALRSASSTSPIGRRRCELPATIETDAGLSTVTVHVPGTGTRTLMAFSDETVATPEFVRANQPSNLHATTQRARLRDRLARRLHRRRSNRSRPTARRQGYHARRGRYRRRLRRVQLRREDAAGAEGLPAVGADQLGDHRRSSWCSPATRPSIRATTRALATPTSCRPSRCR